MSEPTLDVITIGRSSVDLYGAQVGGRLEDMASFSKAVGGCPTNIAIGTARLGLKSGLITRVGDEHMGRFIREQCAREGVDVAGVRTDPDAADLAGAARHPRRQDLPADLLSRQLRRQRARRERHRRGLYRQRQGDRRHRHAFRARQHRRRAEAAPFAFAKKHGRKVAFDIDYRPNLWGLAGHGAGEERYIKSDQVSAHLQPILPLCDLIVGTEEEIMIAGGVDDPLARAEGGARALAATIVMKRGPMGCVVFPGAIPDSIEDGVKGPGFPVEVYNVLGAGDAFMSGFLRGWLRDEPIETCCAYANAGGAFAVSRLLCSAEYPTWAGAAPLPRTRLAASRAAPRRRPQPHPLGDDAPRAAAEHHGARDRPSRATRKDRRRRRRAARAHRRASSGSPSRRRRRSRRAGPASACCSTASTAARRCSAPPTTISGSAGRSRSRARGRSISSSAARSAPS